MSNGDSDTEREGRLRSVLHETTELLDRAGVPWAIAGAFAADEYRGTHRFTTDADLLVQWRDELPTVLEQAGWNLDVKRDAGEPHLIRARRGLDSIDLIVGGTEYQSLAIRRANRGPLTIEDVLIHKVIAWRPKDRDDIRSILTAGEEYDRAYVDHWVREWDVEDRWREALTWS
ncbi:MAG: hypothetical protein WD271_01225 [Acidimicrobiia bacterium]